MKINVAYPTNATQMSFELKTKEEQRLYGKKISDQFDGSLLSPNFAGSIVQIVGGNDYQGTPMNPKQATTKRIRLLLNKGDIGYRCRRNGVRRRMTVRGSVVSNETQVVNVVLVRPAENIVIEGLTDTVKEKTHLPRKDKKLRALFGVPENQDTLTFIHGLLKKENPDAELPKIKITGVVSEEKKRMVAEIKAEREKKRALLQVERANYEKEHGVKL